MYEAFSQFLVNLRDYTLLWAVAVILAMAVTAVALYFFWDFVGRGVSLARSGSRARGARRPPR